MPVNAQAFEADYSWQRRFLPALKRIVGEHLIQEAPPEEDASHNTDLIVLKLDAVRIGCRVRREEYLSRYPDEFTIRCSRPSGTKTELAKIIEGWGDYILYGFGDDQGTLIAWVLGDLRVFRLWFNSYCVNHHGEMPGQLRRNDDGSSEFRAYLIPQLPAGFIVARKARSGQRQEATPPAYQIREG